MSKFTPEIHLIQAEDHNTVEVGSSQATSQGVSGVLVQEVRETMLLSHAEQGPRGAPGLSAYQLAVSEGYVGTMAEWLASLEGEQGEKGEQGLPGLAGANFVHTQSVPSDEWVIKHDLNRFPSVTVVDSAGSVVCMEESYDSPNQVTLRSSAAFSGKAFLN